MLTPENLDELRINRSLLLSLLKELYPIQFDVLSKIDTVAENGYGSVLVKIHKNKIITIEQTISMKV